MLGGFVLVLLLPSASSRVLWGVESSERSLEPPKNASVALEPPSGNHSVARPTLHEIGMSSGTDKAIFHQYTMLYEPHLAQWRDVQIKLIEIGVLNGNSIRLWDDYFQHPLRQIFGVDRVPHPEDARLLQADQSNATDLARLAAMGPWTVVVDDGSHNPGHQILTFEMLFPALQPGGLYIVEDIEENYWHRNANLYGYRRGTANIVKMMKEVVNSAAHINSVFGCDRVPPAPVFGGGVDNMIASVTFIRNSILVRKVPPGFRQHKKYRFRHVANQECKRRRLERKELLSKKASQE